MRRVPVPKIDVYHNQVMPEPNSGCWIWIGSCETGGYGHFHADGGFHRAHRISWEQHRGLIPDGWGVYHKCDNRKCVNPDHLFVGVHADNMADMAVKGRGTNVLSHEDVQIVRRLREEGLTYKQLATRFGVAESTAWEIVNRQRAWRHV